MIAAAIKENYAIESCFTFGNGRWQRRSRLTRETNAPISTENFILGIELRAVRPMPGLVKGSIWSKQNVLIRAASGSECDQLLETIFPYRFSFSVIAAHASRSAFHSSRSLAPVLRLDLRTRCHCAIVSGQTVRRWQ